MLDFTGTYTDQYQLTMGQVYFMKGHSHHKAIFDYFFRKAPFKGGYAVFAGLQNVLEILSELKFNEKDLKFLKELGLNSEYIDYLKDFRFTGQVYSVREGEVVFPGEPIIRIEANIIEAQIIETLLLNIINFQTLHILSTNI